MSAPETSLYAKIAAIRPRQLTGNRESQSRSILLRGEQRLKDSIGVFRMNSRSRVAYLNEYASVNRARRDRQYARFRPHCLDRVAQEVPEHLAYLVAVNDNLREIRVDVALELDVRGKHHPL